MTTFQEITEWIRDNLLAANANVAIKIPGLELSFSTEDIRHMMADTEAIRTILSRCFIQRRLFYVPYEKERPALVETSALEVVSILPEEIAQLRGAAGQSAPLVRLLLQLESATVHLRQMVQELNDDSWQSLEKVLFSFRRDAIPLVDVLINLLADRRPNTAKSRGAGGSSGVFIADKSSLGSC